MRDDLFDIEDKDTNDSIDISPLIDCVFILLIFFMVTTTFIKDTQIDIEKPNAKSATISNTKATRVSISDKGEIFIDGSVVRKWSLQTKVRSMLKTKSDKSVLVVSDKKVPADILIEVVDYCKLAGASTVGVSTDKI